MGAATSQDRTPVSATEISTSKEDPQRPNSAAATTTTTMEATKSKEESAKSDQVPLHGTAKAKEAATKAVAAVVRETKEAPKNFPHMYEAIVKNADDGTAGSGLDRVRAGIFLNNKKKKYWVDERTGQNCFMLFARDLLITWSENQQYWQWVSLNETRDVQIEAASLLNVCWLEVHGRLDVSHLTPGNIYEIVFVVMMEIGYGWATPVNLMLKLPDGSTQQHKENLLEKPKGQWFELKAGEFMAHKDQAGQVEFSLFEYEGGQWKRGLIVKGAIVRPKK